MKVETCRDAAKGGCEGTPQWRESLTGTGLRMFRCTAHHREALNRARRSYVLSDVPPPSFDPTFAGERWDEYEG